jgi:hypothetical protein
MNTNYTLPVQAAKVNLEQIPNFSAGCGENGVFLPLSVRISRWWARTISSRPNRIGFA